MTSSEPTVYKFRYTFQTTHRNKRGIYVTSGVQQEIGKEESNAREFRLDVDTRMKN
jgi:hypothetical protein